MAEEKGDFYNEYLLHKKNCGDSFKDIRTQLSSLNLAMYGDKKNNVIGMIMMVTEIHEFFYSAKISAKLIRNILLAVAFLSGLYVALSKILTNIINKD